MALLQQEWRSVHGYRHTLFEIIIAGAKAERTGINDVKQYAVKKEYGQENATGVEASISISGRFFMDGADGSIRIAKGAPTESRSARFYFNKGAYLDLSYLHSDIEYNSDNRGSWALYENGAVVESGSPKGPNNSEVFVEQIVDLCRGKNTGLTMHEIDLLFGPQWQYQDMVHGMGILTSEKEVDAFVSKVLVWNRVHYFYRSLYLFTFVRHDAFKCFSSD
jgi:hypothetical protein